MFLYCCQIDLLEQLKLWTIYSTTIIYKFSLKMSVSTIKENKGHSTAIQVMKDKDCVKKLYYITVLY